MKLASLACLFAITIFQYVTADSESMPWVIGNVSGISHIKNKHGEVETVVSLSIKKYSGLETDKIINYLQFKAYLKGGVWDGVEYPHEIETSPALGHKALLYLSYNESKFYISKMIHRSSFEKLYTLIDGNREVGETSSSYQLGNLSKPNSRNRSPAQSNVREGIKMDDFGIFFFSLFLIIFGVSLYLTSRNNQNE